MSTDPFDEAPHDHSAPVMRPLASPLIARSRSDSDVFSPAPLDTMPSPSAAQRKNQKNVAEHDPHADQTRASPAMAVMHRRGMSTDGLASQDNSHAFLNAVPANISHNRSRSHEFEDHMLGSIYAPRELCPKCKCPRSSSVWCAASKLHHGTDAAMPEERPIPADDPANANALGAAGEPSEPAGAGDSSVTPKKKGWSIFKTKEEKQLAALEEEEDVARKRLTKSKSNSDGEKGAREVIRGAFADGLAILLNTEKGIALAVQVETHQRARVTYDEDAGWRAVLKQDAKEQKAILKKNPDAIMRSAVARAAAAADDADAAASPAPAGAGAAPESGASPSAAEPESPAGVSTRGASAIEVVSPSAATDDDVAGSFANSQTPVNAA